MTNWQLTEIEQRAVAGNQWEPDDCDIEESRRGVFIPEYPTH